MDIHAYYNKHFPFALLMRWITYNGLEGIERTYDKRREFVFVNAEDRWTRYLSVSGATHWHSMVCAMRPARIELGAIYPVAKVDRTFHQSITVPPEAKELVFDIDVTDYEEQRTECPCKDKAICQQCWAFIACAIQALQYTLEENFGFKHLLFVFSGRRGVHCWVCDIEAHRLDEQARKNVVVYYKDWSRSMMALQTEGRIHKILREGHERYYGAERTANATAEQIVDRMAPRLDEEVTRKMGHAIKLPFCVHPSTGNVCVPIDPADPYAFSLERVPNIETAASTRAFSIKQDLQYFRESFLDPLRKYYSRRGDESGSENDESSSGSDGEGSDESGCENSNSDSDSDSDSCSSSSYYSSDEYSDVE